jgi:hypothetical protein
MESTLYGIAFTQKFDLEYHYSNHVAYHNVVDNWDQASSIITSAANPGDGGCVIFCHTGDRV